MIFLVGIESWSLLIYTRSKASWWGIFHGIDCYWWKRRICYKKEIESIEGQDLRKENYSLEIDAGPDESKLSAAAAAAGLKGNVDGDGILKLSGKFTRGFTGGLLSGAKTKSKQLFDQ